MLGKKCIQLLFLNKQQIKSTFLFHCNPELWYSMPGVIPGLGSNYGKAVTWIYASLDQTLLKLDENLINTQNLKVESNIF